MKRILGLDLGTNSIGWAVVSVDENNNPTHIEGMGSRIIPMGSDKIDYEKGVTITKNADRREKRSARRMCKRYKIRRNKLIYILARLNMLPNQIQLKSGFPEAIGIQDLELLPIRKKTIQLDSLSHYELREKALHERIELKELGKILYQYNRLRGYSGGGQEEENQKAKAEDDRDKKYEVLIQTVTLLAVEKSDMTYTVSTGKDKGTQLSLYNVSVRYEDQELKGTTRLQNLIDKIGSEIELEVRIKRTKKGESITFALPQKTNWRKQMEETERILKERNYYPCQLFAEELRRNKWTKVRNRVILRQQYKREFDAVWDEQAKHYPILADCPTELLNEIVHFLYPGPSKSQEQLRNVGLQNGLKYIIKEQVIYYQRPIKTQEDLIGTCQFEKEEKVIPISHPLFQEFRCWDQINRLFITSKQEVWNDKKKKYEFKYQDRYLTEEQKTLLFQKLQYQKRLGFNDVAKIVNLNSNKNEFLNGLNVNAKLIGCETLISIKKIVGDAFECDATLIEQIWGALYHNVYEGSEYDENSKRIQSIVNVLPNILSEKGKIELAMQLAQNFKIIRKYGNLSKKAIEKILPIMRVRPSSIPKEVRANFENITLLFETGEIKDDRFLQDYIIKFVKNNQDALEKGGLMYAFASAIVYGRHTKEKIKPQIKNYHDLKYVERDLRNPIVEQIANETMQVVKSLWKTYKLDPNNLEIRVELARDLKNSASEREGIYKRQNENRRINESIKKKLQELKQEVNDRNIELYKLWSKQENPFDQNGNPVTRPKFKDAKSPTQEEIQRIRLWEEQHYVSPYTLRPIPLSALFSSERLYDIDHIIPKSRYFDNSMTNKVVCETYINEEKDNRTAWEYISQQNSQYKILPPKDYLNHINNNFFGKKKKNFIAVH